MERTDVTGKFRGFAPHLLLLALVSFFLFFDLGNIFNFPGYSGLLGANGADEGVFLMTARLVSSGAGMYTDINTHQGPFFSLVLSLLGGDPLLSRSMMALLGIASILGVMFISYRLSGKKAAMATGAFLACNFIFFKESRHVGSDLFASSLLVMAMVPLLLYLERLQKGGVQIRGKGPFILMVSAGALLSISSMSKLFGVVPVLFIGMYLLLEWVKKHRREETSRMVFLHLVVLVLSTFFATLLLLSIYGFRTTLDGILLDTLDRPSMSMADRMGTILYVAATASVPIILSVFAVRKRWSDPRVRAVVLWAAPLTLFLLIQSTIWDHYFMIVLPPIAILGGVGYASLIQDEHTEGEMVEVRSSGKSPLRMIVPAIVVIFVVVSGGLNGFMVLSTGENIEHRIAKDIREISGEGDMVISGDPLIPLYADRDQPAGATNLAQLRFPALTDSDLVNITADEDVKVVVICYNLVNYEGYTGFIMEHFDFHRGYQRPDTVTEVEGEVEVHLNTFNVYLRPDDMDGDDIKELYFAPL